MERRPRKLEEALKMARQKTAKREYLLKMLKRHLWAEHLSGYSQACGWGGEAQRKENMEILKA